MSKTRKKWIIILGISLILVIMLIWAVGYTIILQKSEPKEFKGEPLEVEYTVEKLRDATKFFSVQKCIQDNREEKFIAKKMNILNAKKIASYAVYGYINEEESQEEQYYIVRVDLNHKTFLIEKLNEQYENLDQIDLETDMAEIESTGHNTFEYTTVTVKDVSEIYLKNFLTLELNDTEKAYDLLDAEYRKEKFPNFEEYEQYVNENKRDIENLTVTDCTINYMDDQTQYYITDSDNHSYTIKEDCIMNYVILLDV